MQRTTDRRLARAGAWVLCLWGAGHIITVDVLLSRPHASSAARGAGEG